MLTCVVSALKKLKNNGFIGAKLILEEIEPFS